MKLKLLTMILMLGLFSCNDKRFLETVEEVDIERYMGTWYEIARLPNSFEKGLDRVTATYTLKENGKVDVLNKGYKVGAKEFKEAKGKAWVVDPLFPARLKVSFFWPFAGDYHIIALDADYQYALVGDPSRKYLWILSRKKEMDELNYSKLIKIASEQGFKVEEILLVNQGVN